MSKDITVKCNDGIVNVRVGAIIIKDNKVLMARNDRDPYYYSVGGRIQFGESSEQAIKREVKEELGLDLEIDRLGFVHENFFMGDFGEYDGKLFYEICFYYYMKVPEEFNFVCESVTESGLNERMEWVSFDTKEDIYPSFFRTELKNPVKDVRHIIVDERV